jgi:protein SCO1/2
MTRRMKWVLAILAAFVAFDGVALVVVLTMRHAQVAITGKVVQDGTAAIGGPFALAATNGKTVTDQTFRGKWQMLYFGYTYCPDACPTALSNIGSALQKLGLEADQIQPLFVSVDPKRDTREAMSAYLQSFDPRIIGLTGTRAQIDAIAKAYRVYFKIHEGEGDKYVVDHSAYFYLMDPAGRFVDVIEGATPGDQMADKLRVLIAAHSA